MRTTTLILCLGALFLSFVHAAPQEPTLRVEADLYREDLKEPVGVVALTGQILVSQREFEISVPRGGVVLWVDTARFKELRQGLGGSEDEKKEEKGKGKGEARATGPSIDEFLGPIIHELYAEGNVTFRRGNETIRAERMYYNFAANRAVIIKAEVRGVMPEGESRPRVPLIVRADRLVQVAKDEMKARDARITTNPYASPHYQIRVDDLTLTRRDIEYYVSAKGNKLEVGGVPVFWFPYLYGATDLGLDPIRGIKLGTSSKFGLFTGLSIGSPITLGEGPDAPVWGRWSVDPIWRAHRGFGLGVGLDYGLGPYRGSLEGFYQRDRRDEDRVTHLPVPRENRGRARWRHRHVLSPDFHGGRLIGIGEYSWLSDRGFLPEFYPSEDKEGKAQEIVGYLSWAGGIHAASLSGRWRANEFQTQTEYRPRIAYDLFDLPLAHDLLGLGIDASFAAEAELAKVLRVHDHKTGLRGTLTDRAHARGTISTPFSLGPFRVSPTFGAGVTSYRAREDADRLDLSAGARISIDFWKTWPEFRSDTFDLSGLRHAVDVSMGWANRYSVDTSGEHALADPRDMWGEVHALDLRIRNRLQTKRAGAVVDWIDLELRGLFFPEAVEARRWPFGAREEWGQGISSLLLPEEEKFLAIDRKGFGPILADLRAQLRPDLFLVADLWYDLETDRFETYSEGLRYEASESLSLYLGHRAIQGDSSLISTWVDFGITNTWSARLYQQVNFRRSDRLVTGVTLRRAFHDFVVEFRFRRNAQERDTSFSVGIEPKLLFDWNRKRRAEKALDFSGMRWYR